MRVCPKCRNFYAGETLKFCPADGILLVGVDRSSEHWTEGTEAVRKTTRKVQRQIRRQKLMRVVSVTVTTVLTVMVIYVAVLNSYIYLSPEEKEIAQAVSPEQPPVVKAVPAAQPAPVAVETSLLTTNTPSSPLPCPARESLQTTAPMPGKTSPLVSVPPPPPVMDAAPAAIPIPSPTSALPTPAAPSPQTLIPADPPAPVGLPLRASVATDAPESTPAEPPSPVSPKTKEKTPEPARPAVPASCSATDKDKVEEMLRIRFASTWEREIEDQESILFRKQFSLARIVRFKHTTATLELPVDISVKPSKNCKKISVKVKYTWHLRSVHKQEDYGGIRSYQCSFDGGDWVCQMQKRRLFCVS